VDKKNSLALASFLCFRSFAQGNNQEKITLDKTKTRLNGGFF
jgi:hypothetical protein